MSDKSANHGLRRVFLQIGDWIKPFVPEKNFITIHYLWFVGICLVAATVFWASSTPLRSINYTDSLFLCMSAVTESGLNSVDLSTLNTWQQVMLLLLILVGSPIFVSFLIVLVRLKAFERAFVVYKEERENRKLRRKRTGFTRAKLFVPKALSRAKKLPQAFEVDDDQWCNTKPTSDTIVSAYKSSLQLEAQQSTPNLQHGNIDSVRTPGLTATTDLILDMPRIPYDTGKLRLQQPQLRPRRSNSLDLSNRHDEQQVDHFPSPSVQPETKQNSRLQPYPKIIHTPARSYRPILAFTGVGASAAASLRSRPTPYASGSVAGLSRARPLLESYDQSQVVGITSMGWVSRNSQFHGLSVDERQRLGGREYRAVVFLSFLIPIYLLAWQVLGAIALGAYMNNVMPRVARDNGVAPWWVGTFNALSAFNNSGMSLLDANMIAFQNSAFILISMSLFILAGNTAYPILLRAAVWSLWFILPANNVDWHEDKATLRFLLDHPRRVYTNMFPSRHTWWLAISLIVLNAIDWLFFEILSIGDESIEQLSNTTKILGGLFQAFAVRSGGFYVVPISLLRLSLQFLYVVMMYIAVYPVTMTIRSSNVYEERSLGIFTEDLSEPVTEVNRLTIQTSQAQNDTTDKGRLHGLRRRVTDFAEAAAPAPTRERRSYFMRQQLRAQLAHDAWFAVLAIFLILIIEVNQLEKDPVAFSVFNVIFEVISAYATVGLSVGLPNKNYSFSGSWSTLSKLVLCAVMLRGRHRGLPVAIDHAVQLPGSRLWEAEDEDGEKRIEKFNRSYTTSSEYQRYVDTVTPRHPRL